jgi:DNA invertase Pin-like site-specific DNA recombinase
MAKIGYARVSTRSQNDDSQIDDLTAYGCDKIFTDKASGKNAARPELDRALAYLREGDVLVITRLSRAMRSLKHLLARRRAARAQRRLGRAEAADRHDHADRAAGVQRPRRDR